MTRLRYDGEYYTVSTSGADDLMRRMLEIVNSGRYEYVEINEHAPTWVLVGPGLPLVFDRLGKREPYS